MRGFYKESNEFANFVDNIKPDMLHQVVDFIFMNVKSHNNESYDPNTLKSLLDEDLCIAIQNLCQAKKREHHRREFINSLLEKAGFGQGKLLKRYVKRKNVRKFVAPFHFYSDDPISKLLYGDGWVDCIAQKHS